MWDGICSLLLMVNLHLTACEAPTVDVLNGYIETEPLRIAAKTSGRIEQMLVNLGEAVSKDQVLFTLDSEVIRAPKSAQVEQRYYQAGEWVNTGSPVISLLTPEQYKLRFFVPETKLGIIKVGDSVQFECDGCNALQAATIRFIAQTAEYTPPILYTKEQRAKLVYLVEALPTDTHQLHAGQPVSLWLSSSATTTP